MENSNLFRPALARRDLNIILSRHDYCFRGHKLSSFKPGLGQGFRIYEKLIRQIILTLHQVTCLNDLDLGKDDIPRIARKGHFNNSERI